MVVVYMGLVYAGAFCLMMGGATMDQRDHIRSADSPYRAMMLNWCYEHGVNPEDLGRHALGYLVGAVVCITTAFALMFIAPN